MLAVFSSRELNTHFPRSTCAHRPPHSRLLAFHQLCTATLEPGGSAVSRFLKVLELWFVHAGRRSASRLQLLQFARPP